MAFSKRVIFLRCKKAARGNRQRRRFPVELGRRYPWKLPSESGVIHFPDLSVFQLFVFPRSLRTPKNNGEALQCRPYAKSRYRPADYFYIGPQKSKKPPKRMA